MRSNSDVTRKNQPGKTERGQAIIIIVFAMIGLIAMTALAVDGGRIFLEDRRVQNAADSIALGAAMARVKDPQGDWGSKAYAIGRSNGYDNNGASNSIRLNSPPVNGTYAGDIEYIEVRVFSTVETYFGGVVGFRRTVVAGQAISRTKTPEVIELLEGNALVSLRPTSECENPHEQSFWVHGESTLSISGGGIFVNSNNPECALQQSGSGSIRIEDAEAQIKVVGGMDVQKTYLLTPAPTLNSAPIAYPPPFFMPQAGCAKPIEVAPDGKSVSSGSWEQAGSFPPEGVQELGPGVYCVPNFVPEAGAEIGGTDVVIVTNGSIKISEESAVNLSAPNGGALAGLLFYAPMNNHKTMIFNLNKESSLRGTILAPGAEIRLNGNDSDYGFHSQIIGYSILSDGTSEIKIVYKDEENYDAYTMPEVQLVK